jgi:aryl-alcohol dehydrogenase-like predicted oxidoreductase
MPETAKSGREYTMKRKLGRSGVEISALGMGCWAIGGPHSRGGSPVGWGAVNDTESIRGLQRAFELGVDFFDTADVYGCGHSEKLIAQALGDKRDQIVIATKAGYTYIEETREAPGANGDPDYIRHSCDESLRRLGTDYIDLYQFHLGGHPLEKAPEVLAVFDELVTAGKVRYIGWSTDDPARAELFAQSPHCAAIQQAFSLFGGNEATLGICEKYDLASILRGPLAMGMLTGKFTSDTTLPDDDIRRGWNFKEGGQAENLKKVESLRDVLTAGGRTVAQGALGWLWAHSPVMIPIPGFKTVAQVEENAGALAFGPLSDEQMRQIDQILGR